MRLLDSIRRSLERRWGTRISEAAAIPKGDLAVRDAFLAGYRKGYWDGVSDLAEAGADADMAQMRGQPAQVVAH